MIYEITCSNPNGETETFTIQDTENITINIEYQENENFLTFTNYFNQQTEKSPDMDNLFNFLSKKNKDFNINVNVNENKFNYIDFQTITNIRYTIDLNTVENNKNNTKIFVAAIQIEFERGDEV